MHSIFFDLTIIFLLAGTIAFIVSFFKQPSLIAYIATGVIIGPLGYYRLSEGDILKGLSELGITLLLFMVGLDLDFSGLKKMGRVALTAGLAQIIFTSAAGFGVARLIGFDVVPAAYIALALTFSSGIIAVKLLNEKKDLHSLYGKLAVGILLIQDLAIMLTLILLTGSSINDGSVPLWENIFFTLVKTGVIAVIIIWLSTKVFPIILRHAGKSDELLLVCSLAWALGFSAFVSLPFIGLNLEIGGFLAGLALANTASHYQIGARIKSLRDFFLILFLISLGSQLVFVRMDELFSPIIILSLFVLIANPLIILFILGVLGYKPRTGLLTGLTLAQVSEFSLIIIGLGYKLEHISQSVASLVTIVTVITMIVSSYLVTHANAIYRITQPFIKRFDFRKGKAEKNLQEITLKNHIVLVGAHRLGSHLIHSLRKQKQEFIIIDHDPQIIESYQKDGLVCICGDVADPYIQELGNLDKASLIISTVPDFHDNLALIESIKSKNPRIKMIFAAHDETEALQLYDKKVDYALLPHFIGGEHLAQIFEDKKGLAGLKKLKDNHLKTLRS